MSDPATPARQAQAISEIGTTDVGRATALLLSFSFLVVIGSLLPVEVFVSGAARAGESGSALRSPIEITAGFAASVRQDVARLGERGWVATNRAIERSMATFETDLEESSLQRRALLPSLQWQSARLVGLGNEQAYLGRDGWLFYRPDVDYVIGRGFLEPAVLTARERSGESWEEPPRPDPMPALLDLRAQLAAKGIELLVVPIPVKPVVEPDQLTLRAQGVDGAVHNRSYRELLARAQAAGLDLYDPTPELERARIEGSEPLFLRTDTHWTPHGLDVVARGLAAAIGERLEGGIDTVEAWSRRPVTLQGLGDIAQMLWIPSDQQTVPADRVESNMVVSSTGSLWRSDPSAPVLLLGDSFTNVYSDSDLGWGTGAGLAEQLSYFTGGAIDRVARNAGGALGSRQALQQILRRDPQRLAGKSILIYQFAARELAQGDWQRIDLGLMP